MVGLLSGLTLWSGSALADGPALPLPFARTDSGTSASIEHRVTEAGPLWSQRLRAAVRGQLGWGCERAWTCVSIAAGTGGEASRLRGPRATVSEAGFAGASGRLGWWPVLGATGGVRARLGVSFSARDLWRDDDAGGVLDAAVEGVVSADEGGVGARFAVLRRPAAAGFEAAAGARGDVHVRICEGACVEIGAGATALESETVGRVRLGVAGAGVFGARAWLQRELEAGGASTVGVEWLW